MAINVSDFRRRDRTPTTPIIRSQRSFCAFVVHRYTKVDITKLLPINLNKQNFLAGSARSTDGNVESRQPLVVRQDITRCVITNNKDGVGGNFSISIKRGKQIVNGSNTKDNVNYLQAIHPGDWIMIYMKKSGEITDADLNSIAPSSGLKFLGIVENVRYVELDDPSSAAPSLEFVITGRSFAKVFDTNLFFNPVANQANIQSVLGAKFLSDASKTVNALSSNTVDTVIKKLVQFYLKGSGATFSEANQNWYVPDTLARSFKTNQKSKTISRAFVDMLDTSRIGIQKYRNGQFLQAASMQSQGLALIKSLPSSGTIWSVLQFLQNAAINEMYTELVNVNGKLKPSLVLRQVPFSNKKAQETNVYTAHTKYTRTTAPDLSDSEKTFLVDLPRTEIISADIRQKNVGKSDHERINYVMVVPRIDSNTTDALFVASSNVPSIQRHGIRIFQAQTQYVLDAKGSQNKQAITRYCERAVQLIQDWFFLVHNLYNGTIIIDGRDDFIEVGTNLFIKDIRQLYHIEGYTHSYEVTSNSQTIYTTELRVSRGQVFNPDNQLSKFIGISNKPEEPTTIVTSFVQKSKEQ